ncbi:hypothetical protein FRC02_004929 [Tulasnella sp. 418]|nr:hypothetical protein FRC02_004929 [Tulasnella sp. 418]
MPLVNLKDALLTVRKHTVGYTEAQAKIVSATTDHPRRGVPFVSVTQRFELAKLSFDEESFEEITEILTKRLKDISRWRRVTKALIILNYCLVEGSPKFEAYCKEHNELLTSLERFQYVFEENTDRGVLVRKEARKVLATLGDPAYLTRVRQHTAAMRRQQAGIVEQETMKKESRFSIRRRLTKYRGMGLISKRMERHAQDNTERIDLEGADNGVGPVSLRQKIRAAIMSTEGSFEATAQSCKDIARQTASPADFMIILETFIECLATDQQRQDWGQVIKAMILLRVCLNNVSEEIALEFSDDPYVANILKGFNLASFEDRDSVYEADNLLGSAMDAAAQTPEMIEDDLEAAWEIAGEVKREFESKAEPPSYANATLPESWNGLGAAGNMLATIDAKVALAPDTGAGVDLDYSEEVAPRRQSYYQPNMDGGILSRQHRPLPLPPTVWARLHQTAPGIQNVSTAATDIQDLKPPLHATQQISPGSEVISRRSLPSVPVVLQDTIVPDFSPPPYSLSAPEYDTGISAESSTTDQETETCSSENVSVEIPSKSDDILVFLLTDEDLEYVEDIAENTEDEIENHSVDLQAVVLTPGEENDEDDEVESYIQDAAEEVTEPLSRLDPRPTVAHIVIPPTSLSGPSCPLSSPVPIAENLTGRIDYGNSGPIAYGGFSDVFKGKMKLDDGEYEEVCVKTLRAVKMRSRKSECGVRMEKRMHREMEVWQMLDHPNVVPLKGYVLDPDSDESPSLVSPWYSNGNVLEYIARNPFADRKKLVRQVAQGLIHLHNQSTAVVHGDIKGGNVLIDSKGNAALADFGLSQIIQECPSNSASSAILGSVRWCAPEILMSDDYQRTLASDVWAFGVLALEILTSRQPYYTVSSDVKVVIDVGSGKIPAREDYPELPKNNRFWRVLEACWRMEPSERPSMNELASQILDDDAFAQDD